MRTRFPLPCGPRRGFRSPSRRAVGLGNGKVQEYFDVKYQNRAAWGMLLSGPGEREP